MTGGTWLVVVAPVALALALLLAGPALPREVASTRLPTRRRPVLGPGVAEWVRGAVAVRLRRGSAARAVTGELAGFVDSLAAELGAGVSPRSALEQAAAGVRHPGLRPMLEGLAHRVRLGADPAQVLWIASREPGSGALGWVAAAWEVAERHGVALAPTVARVAAALRADTRHRNEVAAGAAGARASARLLTALPLVGGLMGQLLGADPVRVLLTTPAGLACLLLGGALEVVGFVWTGRIVRAAEGPA